MPTRGMRSAIFKSSSVSKTTPPSSTIRTFSEALLDENIERAKPLIMKWNADNSSYAKITSLFREGRREAKQYLFSVGELQYAMQQLVAQHSGSERFVRAQNLMKMAMKRLENEFSQILSVNREYLDPESVSVCSSKSAAATSSGSDLSSDESEDEFREARESISGVENISSVAMADLEAIADCMIASGYGNECVKIYKIVRKSIVDEALHHLGVERLSPSRAQKMDWEVLELKIKNWLNAVKISVKTLFHGERILCDHVFSASASIRESCFFKISIEAALNLFWFPEIVAKCKKSPKKMFRTLDMYEAISDNLREIESIFSSESTMVIRALATTALVKLSEEVRTMLTDFEKAIRKDSSKNTPGGGVHPLTRYVMNYLSFLTDYSDVLSDIVADWPLSVQSPLPESYFGSPASYDNPLSVRVAWLILVLLCKLDVKAQLYKDVALSYLLLANNLQYIVVKVRSSNLKLLLGDDWVKKHKSKVKQYAGNYERIGWSKVVAPLTEKGTAEVSPEQERDGFRQFNAAFDEVYRKQNSWVVPDAKLADEIKVSVAKKLMPAYRNFYQKNQLRLRQLALSESLIRFTPDDLANYLSDLFRGTGVGGNVSSSSCPSHSLRRLSR